MKIVFINLKIPINSRPYRTILNMNKIFYRYMFEHNANAARSRGGKRVASGPSRKLFRFYVQLSGNCECAQAGWNCAPYFLIEGLILKLAIDLKESRENLGKALRFEKVSFGESMGV